MINLNKQTTTSHEERAIGKLNELSLYLEISSQNNSLNNLKQQLLVNISEEFKIQKELKQTTERLRLHLNSLTRFGIDPTDTKNVQAWMKSCQTFLNNLDMVEYAVFLNIRATFQNLELFGNQEYGKSFYHQQPENYEKKKELEIALKIG